MTVRLHRSAVATALLVLGLLMAACGSSPTDTAQPAGSRTGGRSLADVYAAVRGLTGQQRYDKLLEMAKSDGGRVDLYHAADVDNLVKKFQDKTGLTVDDYKATSERAAERVNQEHEAGQVRADVVILAVDDLLNLQMTGAIGSLDSPALNAIPDDFKAPGVVGMFGIELMPTYNTNAVKSSALPSSWEDFFTSFHGRKAIEQTDWFWYEAMVEKYFVAQKGMTEQEAMNLITNGLHGASILDGHTLTATLLASGQYDYVPNAMANYTAKLQKDGAPVSYEGLPPDMPPSIVTMLSALPDRGPNPAGALLFMEYALSEEGQTALSGMGYVPIADTYTGTTLLDRYPNTIRTDNVKKPKTAAEQDKWKSNFDVLLKSIGGKVLTEPGQAQGGK
jgi:ABC-type Fe3+ transport system substrate-binding protein